MFPPQSLNETMSVPGVHRPAALYVPWSMNNTQPSFQASHSLVVNINYRKNWDASLPEVGTTALP